MRPRAVLARNERGQSNTVYTYVIEADERDRLVTALAAAGVETEVYYPVPLHLQPCFAGLGHRPGDFPYAEAACRHTVALPLYPDLTAAQLDRVCALITRFYTGSGS